MLTELVVTDLGVISELSIVLDRAMTAVTGETGAGKTLVVGAIDLLMGGRADASLVRAGSAEAVVSGRFVLDDDETGADEGREVVIRRVVPAQGRSRAYIDGRPSTAAELAELGRSLVDLHGQHAHQSLLRASVQRAALDQHGGVDLAPLDTARKELAAVDEALAELGGDERARAREIDLLRFQVDEIADAGLDDPVEDEALGREQDRLGSASDRRAAATAAVARLADDGGVVGAVAETAAALGDAEVFADLHGRLLGVEVELADITSELRQLADTLEEDPQRLDAITHRRKLLHDLRRKYGETLADVIGYHAELSDRLAELEDHDQRAAELERERSRLREVVAAAEREVGARRRRAAPGLAAAVSVHLRALGLEKASFGIEVGDDPGDEVTFVFSANPGVGPAPLTKVASGGELARTMLAVRLVLSNGPETLVFDEVDAGIGGGAAIAVGAALAELGRDHQVLVVTHLAQVAAAAAHQAVVVKQVTGGDTTTVVTRVEGDDRVVELARMLSGTPDSDAAREHAAELLANTRRRA